MSKKYTRGIICTLLGGICWGFSGACGQTLVNRPGIISEQITAVRMIFSGIMSAMGFTGVYFPFTGETNINIDAPQVFMPCTVAHEIAHQMGITSESECNFIGILANTYS